jgi:hypothetical protein
VVKDNCQLRALCEPLLILEETVRGRWERERERGGELDGRRISLRNKDGLHNGIKRLRVV